MVYPLVIYRKVIYGVKLEQYYKSHFYFQLPYKTFSTTLQNNISYAQPKADEPLVIEAAKASSIHEISHIFADGYQTMVGEKGVTLSGGQKQRVTLARTLLEDPEILILDDATSAVDTETEFNIQQALANVLSGKTSVVIAHRATSIQNADYIIVMDNGKVIQSGTPDDLENEEGFYKQMLELQTKVEVEL